MSNYAKEMFAVPKEMYQRIMERANEDQKRFIGNVNVDQMNVACGGGPLLAGHKTAEKSESPSSVPHPPPPPQQLVTNKHVVETQPAAVETQPAPPISRTAPSLANVVPPISRSLPPASSSAPDPSSVVKPENEEAEGGGGGKRSDKKRSTGERGSEKKKKKGVKTNPATSTPATVPDSLVKPSGYFAPRETSPIPEAAANQKAPMINVLSPSMDPVTPSFSGDILPPLDLHKVQRKELASLNKMSPLSAIDDVNEQILQTQEKASRRAGNDQELGEVHLSVRNAGKSPNVRRLSETFEVRANNESPSPPQTRSKSESRAKKRRDILRNNGVKITTPPKKPAPKYKF